ncbi:L-gulonolactone oxidase-like [Molothrus aeneus]|uniref:L-gulonolactone oxidase-like n=1 Tax=Molothrus aeneus TaxID=84833 RepID=UPI00345A88AF
MAAAGAGTRTRGLELWPSLDRLRGQSGLRFWNWAGTHGCEPERFYRPRSAAEIRQILELARQQGKRVKVVGGGHSPSDIACTDGFMIHMGHLNRVLQVDKEKLQVKVEAGILLSELNLELDKHGMALEILGAVSEVSVAGVIGTGTHNTGIQLGILATQVVAVTLLLASGEVLECSPELNPELLEAARLHLGALGVLLEVTLQCRPRFRLRQVTFPGTLPQVLDELEQHLSNSRYFRFLWFPHTENVQVIYQDPTDEPPRSASSWFWDYAVGYHLLQLLLWVSTFFPRLVVWINRVFFRLLFSSRQESVGLSHRILNYECRFRQHVQDWAVPIGRARAALLELRAALDEDPGLGAHFPVEIRFCRRDRIPLSPCFQRDSCYINVIMYRPYGREAPRGRYWQLYEGIMRRHGGRPHWAKVWGQDGAGPWF